MKTLCVILFISLTAFMSDTDSKNDTIYFTSLNYAIQQGQFDAVTNVGALRSAGDFGLGSEAKLTRELIVLDGKFYGVDSKGVASAMEDKAQIAYAALKKFVSEKKLTLKDVNDLDALESVLARHIHHNGFAAFKIHGTFNKINFRSFETQDKPYKTVDEVPEIKFEREHISGTIVGYYTPKSAQVLNSPVYHLHFIDDAKKTGGHVLNCSLKEGTLDINYAKEIHIQLPDTSVVSNVELNEPIENK